MELGEKLKLARLEAGLSQRQLCGDTITRNMLSQIENGSAKPSMATLRYLAERLGKTVSFFLEEDAVVSPNQAVMAEIRAAYEEKNLEDMADALARYRSPDPVFEPEYILLRRLHALEAAEKAVAENRELLAARVLEEQGTIEDGYCCRELERHRLLLLARAQPKSLEEICRKLPSLDGELLLRAEAALERKDFLKAEHLLESGDDRESAAWNSLRGQVYQARGAYEKAIECYLKAEEISESRLEICYRELGNFERAYYYACKRR